MLGPLLADRPLGDAAVEVADHRPLSSLLGAELLAGLERLDESLRSLSESVVELLDGEVAAAEGVGEDLLAGDDAVALLEADVVAGGAGDDGEREAQVAEVMRAAKPMAKLRRQALYFGLLSPRLWNMLHAPWNRWMPRAMLATM